MTYCFHFGICLCLVLFQTTVMPYFHLFDSFYDLLSPFVIYLSLFQSLRQSIPVILFFGFLMDSLSGGPFGLYLTTYIWLFIGVKWIITFLHVGDSLLLPFIVAAGVLLQNCIFIGTIAIFEPGTQFLSAALSTVTVQVLWAIFTGPIFLMFFNYSHGKWNKWLKKVFVKES
jgi:cell shape-determining protein MreD